MGGRNSREGLPLQNSKETKNLNFTDQELKQVECYWKNRKVDEIEGKYKRVNYKGQKSNLLGQSQDYDSISPDKNSNLDHKNIIEIPQNNIVNDQEMLDTSKQEVYNSINDDSDFAISAKGSLFGEHKQQPMNKNNPKLERHDKFPDKNLDKN